MKTHEITEWVTDLDRAYWLVRAAAAAGSPEGANAVSREALAVLAELHERMLRAEVRSVVSRSWLAAEK
jgi:hypothetical protein